MGKKIERSNYHETQVQGVKTKSGAFRFCRAYVSIHTTYTANFIKITYKVPQIEQLKL